MSFFGVVLRKQLNETPWLGETFEYWLRHPCSSSMCSIRRDRSSPAKRARASERRNAQEVSVASRTGSGIVVTAGQGRRRPSSLPQGATNFQPLLGRIVPCRFILARGEARVGPRISPWRVESWSRSRAAARLSPGEQHLVANMIDSILDNIRQLPAGKAGRGTRTRTGDYRCDQDLVEREPDGTVTPSHHRSR